jgi:hypothetical protein
LQQEVEVAKKKRQARTRTSPAARPASTVMAWEDDPGAPDEAPARTPDVRPVPALGGTLAIAIKGRTPAPKPYAQKTTEFRYWTAADALSRGIQFWSRMLPAGARWFTGAKLPVTLDAGEDLNAYYDRRGLSFFHRTVRGQMLFSGESPDVVCHELGHAVLDAIRPELWDTVTAEAAAFHESFGDVSALLCNLQLATLRREVLAETSGHLYQSSRLSRLAEQLGWGIRQVAPDQADRDCLRNAVNRFFYRDPNTLPPSGPASSLSSEPHSFSRVFTGAFFQGFAGLVPDSPGEADLLAASEEAAKLLVRAVIDSPIVPDYYSQIAAHVVSGATRTQARDAFRAAFVRHGVLSLQAAVALEPAPAPRRGRGVAPMAPQPVRELLIPGARFGLSLPIRVQAPTEVKRYSVTPAAPDTGSLRAPSVDTAVTAFIEDLFRRGRVEMGSSAAARSAIRHPFTRRTHVLIEREAELTLERRCFDCGFDHAASGA